MEILEVKHVKKVYNTRLGGRQCIALRDVSFEVDAGEFTAIMGASGSGKTTLLNIIASLDKPTAGEVLLEGRSFRDIPDKELSAFRRDNLGFVFQDFNLLDTFSLRDNILLPLVLGRVPLEEMERRLAPLAERLNISALLRKYPYEVSGGEKQRAAVARAIITGPKLLLADEPTGALDSKASQNLLEIFRDLHRQGQTLLMVTHSAMAASYASRVIFIRDGELFSQMYRGNAERRAFFDRIVSTLSVLSEGGADVG
ncbi:MAG: ABC transporter ATP-binding protein [Christensenellales bacterium]|jgi:putative ABC transport system ATP-binding protein|uniref:ABC transporter ATP-binding protein n=1 Tax=Candidatus Avichristensenella intestinipullorum TaxID=2840693 RepID=A0A9D0YU56_9FIRM|nr:ABC transporter ATP-binding protein [Christensenellales bacterium]HIQ62037.1 ABC transporter ATP-binding protein [Candidatus Avichristensenella intestinipullorum]